MFIDFAIGIVTGLATGAFFARKSSSGPERELVFQRIVLTQQQDRSTRVSTTPAESDSNVIAYLVAVVFAALFAASLLSRYQAQILHFGWLLLSFFGSAVLSFTVLTLLRDKTIDRFTLWSFWSTFCAAISFYIFFLFSRSLAEPAYAAYLESIHVKGWEAFRWDALGFQPVFQFIGLGALAVALFGAFSQSFAVLVQPAATRNRLSLRFFRWAAGLLNIWAVLGQAVLFLLAYVALSGKLTAWLSVWLSR